MPGKISQRAMKTARSIKNFIHTLPYRGTGRWCPVCKRSSKKFRPAGFIVREDAECVFCSALERHRFVWLYFEKMTNLFDRTPKKMLHVAPESCFEPALKEKLGENYITADLVNPLAMVRMDVTDIQYPDEYFDIIYCNHVLEHVQDDKKAMREFFRVLKKRWMGHAVGADHCQTNRGRSIHRGPNGAPAIIRAGGPRSTVWTRLCRSAS